MYCSNCGKELTDNNIKFCPYCGTKVLSDLEEKNIIEESTINQNTTPIKDLSSEIKQKNNKKKLSFKFTLDFVLTVIVQIVFVLSAFIYYKIAKPEKTNFVLITILDFISRSCLFTGGYLALKNLKSKNFFSLISIIYFCYRVIDYIFSFIVSFINTIKYSYDGILFKRIRLLCLLILLILLIIWAIIEYRKNKKILKITIIIASVYLFAITAHTVFEHFETKKLYADLESLTKQYNALKSNLDSFTSKGDFGTWTVYLSYDDPDSNYRTYDNSYRHRTRNCYKDYAIQNAKDYLLIDHPRARNIYVDSAIYEGYSSSPID